MKEQTEPIELGLAITQYSPDFKVLALSEIIKNCSGKIIFTGIGKNAFIGAKMAATFSSTGTPSFFIDAVHMVHGDFGAINSNDIIVALSKSGNTSELINCIQYLNDHIDHNMIIGVDFNENSALNEICSTSIHLPLIKELGENQLVPTNSLTYLQFYLDNLAILVMEISDFSKSDFVRTHPGGSIGQNV